MPRGQPNTNPIKFERSDLGTIGNLNRGDEDNIDEMKAIVSHYLNQAVGNEFSSIFEANGVDYRIPPGFILKQAFSLALGPLQGQPIVTPTMRRLSEFKSKLQIKSEKFDY